MIERYNTLDYSSSFAQSATPKSLYYELPVDFPISTSAIPQLLNENPPLSESPTLLHKSDRHISTRTSITTNSVVDSYTASASSELASTRHLSSYKTVFLTNRISSFSSISSVSGYSPASSSLPPPSPPWCGINTDSRLLHTNSPDTKLYSNYHLGSQRFTGNVHLGRCRLYAILVSR